MIRSRLVVTKRTPRAPHGMVTAQHPLGAEVGANILARGGNAVDAAVATAFAMTVVEPFMSTIAGSGTLVVYLARDHETLALNFNACAPARADSAMFKPVGGVSAAIFAWPRVEDDANVWGPRSVAVPGSVKGLAFAVERYGTMTLRDVLAPAIDLARTGFVADWYLALTTAAHIEELSAFPETARTYLRNGRVIYRPAGLAPGDRVTYPDLARSLELIARDGPDAFYRGALAEAITSHLAETGGLVSRNDLAGYRMIVEAPLTGRYRDLSLCFSPRATGGLTALQILHILDRFPAGRVGWKTAAGLHLRAQAVCRAFRDRFEHLGDPAFVKAPWERLASSAYAREVAEDISGERHPRRRAVSRRVRRRARVGGGADCTTHVCAVDADRNMVSLTHTAVSLFGSHMVVPGTGILLNNGMIWFDPEPGKPNSIEPGKRALVNMVPALAFRRGKPYLTIGAPGGRKIISAVSQVIANIADAPARASLQAAIEAPRLHIEDGELTIDDRVGASALRALTGRGYIVVPEEETYASLHFAKPIAIRVAGGGLEAGLDHLRPAAAAGH